MNRAPMQGRMAALLTVTALLALAGCQSALDACRQAHPTDLAAADTCFQAVLQQQNEQLNRMHAEQFRGRE
jgi:uncharacterized protein YecT (DUF1311 family)